jgi:hypothetical protein
MVLDPHQRSVYLEELKPPAGFTLDFALACTYSLDLIALLMAPTAMALYDFPSTEDALGNPLALIEAIRRTSGRVMVFCHSGRIAVPTATTSLYSCLEPMVIQARGRNQKGAFHPKVWLLRFVSDDEDIMYRLVCLSRNMTYDRSWDVSACVEGLVEQGRIRPFSPSIPLRDFVRALPDLAVDEISLDMSAKIDLMSEEVALVRDWDPPPGFDGVQFVPSGIPGYIRPRICGGSRSLVISPFLSDQVVCDLFATGSDNVLVSTVEALDGLEDETLDELADCELATMGDWSDHSDEEDRRPSGLHAKIYLVERRGNVELLVGSANATNAAFRGHNVEFMLKLLGRRRYVGVNKMLVTEEKPSHLASLLLPYSRPDTSPSADGAARRIEEMLERARETLARADFELFVAPDRDGLYSMELRPGLPLSLPAELDCTCRPITLHASPGAEINPLTTADPVRFSQLDMLSLTSFVAFELEARHAGTSRSASFVLNVRAHGMPEGRESAVLRDLMKDEASFVRYVMLLLADDMGAFAADARAWLARDSCGAGEVHGADLERIPLLERMARVYSRDPERLEQIDALMNDLRLRADSAGVIPEEFLRLWDALREAEVEEWANDEHGGTE